MMQKTHACKLVGKAFRNFPQSRKLRKRALHHLYKCSYASEDVGFRQIRFSKFVNFQDVVAEPAAHAGDESVYSDCCGLLSVMFEQECEQDSLEFMPAAVELALAGLGNLTPA